MPKGKNAPVKSKLHLRNKNRESYDLQTLSKINPDLKKHLKKNNYGNTSIDFSNPKAVKLLNKALLSHYYEIRHWDFPDENLCPPIPGRADYIHYVADLINYKTLQKTTCLDIGTGASCIYPILGVQEYNWDFIASDINQESILRAKEIVNNNSSLAGKIECVLQENTSYYFKGIVKPHHKIDLSICNPPFHASVEDAMRGTKKKVKNLTGRNTKKPALNFSGITNELVCDGGEYKFVFNMIKESKEFAQNVNWFTTLISKESNLNGLYKALDKVNAKHKTIPMGTGNKVSRILAWTFR